MEEVTLKLLKGGATSLRIRYELPCYVDAILPHREQLWPKASSRASAK